MGALNCVPKDDAQGGEGSSKGGADGQTKQQPTFEELEQKYQDQVKQYESLKQTRDEDVLKLEEQLKVLNEKLEGQEHIDTLKEQHQNEIEEKTSQIQEHHQVKRNLHLQLNQTKQDKLKAEAAASIYKRKLEEDVKKHVAEKEEMKRKLDAVEKTVSLRGILLKINKMGTGQKVLREVLVFNAEKNLQILIAEPESTTLPREVVTDVSTDPVILHSSARFTAEEISKLIIISTPKKKIPLLCDDMEQRDTWFATIKSRLGEGAY